VTSLQIDMAEGRDIEMRNKDMEGRGWNKDGGGPWWRNAE
jgi:hypothetical protein